MINQVICRLCGKVFTPLRNKEWNEKIAKEEYEKMFPDSPWEDRVIVCDDCYEHVKPEIPWYKNEYN